MTSVFENDEEFNEVKHTHPQFDKIPTDMKVLDQWVAYKLIWDEKKQKYGKPPYSLDGTKRQGFDIRYSFKQVVTAVKAGKVDGIGFALTPNDNFICIDLDGDSLDDVPASIKSISEHSYTEISPSGTGLHVWFKGEKPSGAGGKQNRYTNNEKYKVECFYDTGFLTMTGNAINDLPVEENQMILDYIYDNTTHSSEVVDALPIVDIPIPADEKEDAVIISSMLKSRRSGEKIKALLNGDTSLHNNDNSAADIALCNFLAIYSKCNVNQMDRIFRKSGLYRDKWDKVHHSNGDTYGERTINDAIAWAYPKIKDEFSITIEDQSGDSAEHTTPAIRSTPETRTLKQELETHPEKGHVLSNARNAEKVLASSIFSDVIAFDSFKNTEVIKGDLPWRKRDHTHKKYEPWLGSDDGRLRHYLNKYFDIKTAGIIQDAYIEVSRQNTFHPVKEYLEAQTWDGIPRVETFFIDYLGAEDTPYIRAVTRKWIAAAVTRIYEPGCKFDYMPVLIGAQGVGKSSLIAKLAREWFSDSLRNLENKEAGEHLQAGWIFEFGELAALRKNEVEEIKAFITKQTDSYRVAYERIVSEFPRKCVFIGTTNKSDFLRDQTGNRRFWAIATNQANRKYEIGELSEMLVGQIWAEAMTLYAKGEKLYLDPELEEEAHKIQESHMEVDPRAGLIQKYLDTLLPVEWDTMKLYERINFMAGESDFSRYEGVNKRVKVCAAEIWSECLGNDHKNMKPFEARDICDILRKTGEWEERNPSRTTFKHYGKQTTFVRKI